MVTLLAVMRIEDQDLQGYKSTPTHDSKEQMCCVVHIPLDIHCQRFAVSLLSRLPCTSFICDFRLLLLHLI